MKDIVFDTGPIISIVTNNLLWVLEELKKRYDGEFYISPSVKKEVIDKPLQGKRFKLEALQLRAFISQGTIKAYQPKNIKQLNLNTVKLLNLANNMFMCRGVNVKVVHMPEMEALALAKMIGAEAFIVDERNLRVLIEEPGRLAKLLSRKLHSSVKINKKFEKDFLKEVKDIKIIRSVELMAAAYDFGILDKYVVKGKNKNIDVKKILLEGILWGLKLRGCAISRDEIDEIKKLKGF